MMKIVISPAKTLEFERDLPTQEATVPVFLSDAKKIRRTLKELSPADLSQLMDISDKLAELNWQRNHSKGFGAKEIANDARQAIYTFNGEVYIGLDAYSIAPEKIPQLQEKLRILSGLYGLLKPLDVMQPYRLEMGTKLRVGEYSNLYEYWKTKITKALNKELKKGDFLVNLASHEYFSAIDPKSLKVRVVTPEFKDYKNGKLSTFSFFAKKARGMMVRHIINSNAETIDDLKTFNADGYAFDGNLSAGDTLVFTR